MSEDLAKAISYETLYVARLPGFYRWTTDYETAYQLATGVTSDEGGDDHEEEDRITAWHIPKMPECPDVCPQCGEEVTTGSARWNGYAWEHTSAETHAQAGHHRMRSPT